MKEAESLETPVNMKQEEFWISAICTYLSSGQYGVAASLTSSILLPTVQEEVDRGRLFLPVRVGHPGKHHIWPQCPAEEP